MTPLAQPADAESALPRGSAVKARRVRRHAFLVRWHRWIALTFAIPLIVQIATGAALVFKPEVVRSGPQAAAGAEAPLAAVLAAVGDRYPAHAVTRVDFPLADGAPLLLHLRPRGDAAAIPLVEVDPRSLRIEALGATARIYELVRRVHDELLLPEVGPLVVASTGCSLLFLAITGLVVWWPGASKVVAVLRFPRHGAARQWLFLWHRSLGAVVGLLLIWMASTGVPLSLNSWIAPTPWVAPIEAGGAADADGRVAAAQALFPRLEVRDVRIGSRGGVERVLLYDTSYGLKGPVSQVRFDDATGAVTGVVDASALAPGDAAMAWLYPLHTAQAGGVAARLVLQLAGLTGAAIGITGLALWWVRRQVRAR